MASIEENDDRGGETQALIPCVSETCDHAAFARVRSSTTRNMLVVTVLRSDPTKEEFQSLMDATKREYIRMPKEFVLVLDVLRMNILNPMFCIAWMRLFDEVRPITSSHLLCTHVAYDSGVLQWAVNAFLNIYNPMKPLLLHTSRDACLECAQNDARSICEVESSN